MEFKTILGHKCSIFGQGKISLVIEIGLGASIAEWWHIAQKLAERQTVLLYERKRDVQTERSPENIAKELHQLLSELDCEEK